jgi:hypothetical protein
VVRITESRMLTVMTKEEIFAEATSVYDSSVEALETETFEALQLTREIFRTASFHEVSKPRSRGDCGVVTSSRSG